MVNRLTRKSTKKFESLVSPCRVLENARPIINACVNPVCAPLRGIVGNVAIIKFQSIKLLYGGVVARSRGGQSGGVSAHERGERSNGGGEGPTSGQPDVEEPCELAQAVRVQPSQCRCAGWQSYDLRFTGGKAHGGWVSATWIARPGGAVN